MPAFLLRYKVPEDLESSSEFEKYTNNVLKLASKIQAKASEIFFGWDVAFEVRPFSYPHNQPDFSVTGWITDNDNLYTEIVLKAQAEILALLEKEAFEDQTVECWWQRVKGKWGSGQG